jgi:hypothetical protein
MTNDGAIQAEHAIVRMPFDSLTRASQVMAVVIRLRRIGRPYIPWEV